MLDPPKNLAPNSVDPSLELTLDSLPKPPNWPMALPPTHLTIAKWFESIVDNGELRPRRCAVFDEEMLYFFYGGVFYRTGNKQTRDASELPIAFLFDPFVLNSFARYYPFDTGAVAAGLYGDAGSALMPFEVRYRVSGRDFSVPAKIVYHLFGTNEKYLSGEADAQLNAKPDPLPLLSRFFAEDLCPLGIDKRQTVIECQTNQPIPLKSLLWVGFPDSMTGVFARIIKLTEPWVPQYFEYDSHVIFNPNEVAAQLEKAAKEQVINRFIQPPQARA